METVSLLQSFAMDKDGRIRSVEEVARGLSCECVCPTCGDKVIARQGEVREWHFAHVSGAECENAAEGALHRAAKQLLLESGGMTIPEIRVNASVTLTDGRTGSGEAYRPESWIDFQQVEAEKSFGNIRPDILAVTGGEMLFVEVAVTHFVDDEKREKLSKLHIPTVEIDISSVASQTKWDWELLREIVIENAIYKSWMIVMGSAQLQNEAHEAAVSAALAKPLQMPGTHALNGVRTRFLVEQRIVDVIERPFGVALWSPYDPVLNDFIKRLMKEVGGRWQPKFKNWLAPVEAKTYIFQELSRAASTPPRVVQ